MNTKHIVNSKKTKCNENKKKTTTTKSNLYVNSGRAIPDEVGGNQNREHAKKKSHK